MVNFKNYDDLYNYVENYVLSHRLEQAHKALLYGQVSHKGQFRKDKHCKVPYYVHPLLICCHAIALGFDEDDILATALLHDVCEDCGVIVDELPVSDEIKEAVELLTKNNNVVAGSIEAQEYYDKISTNKVAVIVKLLDRCNNVSSMANAFSKEKMVNYMERTKKYVYPLFEIAKELYPNKKEQIFLIKYQMVSIIDSLSKVLNQK